MKDAGSGVPPAIDAAEFRRTLGQFASGVTVFTTTDAQGAWLGLTLSAFCSLSLDPPLVLACLAKRSYANDALRASALFGISVLAEDQEELSRRFASAGRDKFEGVGVIKGAHGVPLLSGALARLECRLAAAHEAGDHWIYVGRVLNLEAAPGRPLLFHGSRYCRLAAG